MANNTSLIIGASGQDGRLLTNLRLNQGDNVIGTGRTHYQNDFLNEIPLSDQKRFRFLCLDPAIKEDVQEIISQTKPNFIFNLAGPSSVGYSFKHPDYVKKVIKNINTNILESISNQKDEIKYFNACSGDCFGDVDENGANEDLRFNPKSPYGEGKRDAFLGCKRLRDSQGIFCASGILFNHESPLRSEAFFSRKLIKSVVAIKQKRQQHIELGELGAFRDWGYAPDYVVAISEMMELDEPHDFIIGSGKAHSLGEFVDVAFSKMGLNWENYVRFSTDFLRPNDIQYSLANPGKIQRAIGWQVKVPFERMIELLLDVELRNVSK